MANLFNVKLGISPPAPPPSGYGYYMAVGGSITNPANIVKTSTPTYPTDYMTVACHNAATFSPGDTIYISDQGGIFTDEIIAPSSGSAGNFIQYKGVPGEDPRINNSVNHTTGNAGYLPTHPGDQATTWTQCGSTNLWHGNNTACRGAAWECLNGTLTPIRAALNEIHNNDFRWSNDGGEWVGFGSGWTQDPDYNAWWGVAVHSSGTTPLKQDVLTFGKGDFHFSRTTIVGMVYKVTYTIVDRTQGSVTPSLGGVTMAAGSTDGDYGPYYVTATSDTGDDAFLSFTPTTDFNGSITHASAVEFRPGSWHLADNYTDFYWRPSDNNKTPIDYYYLKTIWWEGTWLEKCYGMDLRNKSYVEVSDLTFDYCGIQNGPAADSGAVLVSNIKIHDNTFNYAWWGIWAALDHGANFTDAETYNNTFNYCNGGGGCWGSNGVPIRHNFHHNTINNHSMLDATNSWAWANNNYNCADHENSWMDPVDCTFAYNYFECNNNSDPFGDDLTLATRGIQFYANTNAVHKTSGNKIICNRFIGHYYPTIYFNTDDLTGGGYENNIIAGNVIEWTGTHTSTSSESPFIMKGFGASGNPATGMNYFVNNTINYPNAWANLSFWAQGSNDCGNWTVENNVIVSVNHVLSIPSYSAKYIIDYNSYYGYHPDPTKEWFSNGGNSLTLSQWQALGYDTNSITDNPVLNAANSDLTASSPTSCKSGGVAWSGVDDIPSDASVALGETAIIDIGDITDIHGDPYNATTPSMGADQY